jgi:hypothetical protein
VETPFIAEFEGGRLYMAGPVWVLQLHGTHYQMGRQYGMLLKNQLNEAYDITIATFSPYFTYERMRQIADNVYARYPQKYKDIIIGMAETSGLGLEKQIVLNAMEWFPKINAFVPHCTGVGVWGDYTSDRRLIFGRNNDDAALYRNFGSYVVVAVFNPTDSGMPVAVINYAGVVYAPTGINRAGIFMEVNSGNWQGYFINQPLLVLTMFTFLQDYSTQEDMDAAFQAVLPDLVSIVNVADSATAYSFECWTTTVKRRSPDKNGLLVATNHFVDPSWGLPPPQPDSANGWTAKRRDNLLTWAEVHKGRLNVDKVKEVLDTPITEGGAFQAATIYQVVAVPADLTIWLRAPEHFEWQKIDLNGFFY